MPPRARRRLGGHEAHDANVKPFDPNANEADEQSEKTAPDPKRGGPPPRKQS